MTKVSAKNATILINGNYFSTYTTSYEVEDSVDPLDSTGFQDESKNFVPGMRTAKLTADMLWDSTNVHDAMVSVGQTGIVTIMPEVYAVGARTLSLPYMQGGYSPKGEVSSLLTIGTIDFESSGSNFGIERGKCLYQGIVTDTITGVTIDNGAATSVSYSAVLHVYEAAASDTYSVVVEHSTDGSSWDTLATFIADGSTVTAERKTGTSVYRYRRVVATVTGTDGDNFGFHVNLFTI